MQTKPTCLAIDLDHTLIHHEGEKEGLFRIFENLGYAYGLAKRAYLNNRLKPTPWIDEMVAELHQIKPIAQIEEVKNQCWDWLAASAVCYPDSMESLEEIQAVVPVVIVTHGSEDIQSRKIAATRVPHREVKVLDPVIPKVHYLKELVSQYGAPIVFVDDRLPEIEAAQSPDILRYWIRREMEIDGAEQLGGNLWQISNLGAVRDLFRAKPEVV